MGVAVKPLAKISKKWADRVAVSDKEYVDGVKNPKRDWEDESLDSKDRYEDGIRDSIKEGRRDKGIKKAGTKKWQDRAVKVGPTRWTEGVAVTQDEYEDGFKPYREEIEKVDLPPKYKKGDPRNYERVKAIGTALHALKIAG